MSERGLKWLAAKAEKQTLPKSRDSLVDRGDWLALALIAGLGAYLRWQWTAPLPAILHPDSDSYFDIAQRLWQRGEFGDLSRRTPLYPLLLWITGKSSGIGFDLTLLVQHALGVATALLTYLTARGVMRYRVPSLFAGLMVAAAPVFILTEHSILSESLYTFLLAASGYCLAVASRMEGSAARIPAALCGVFLGAACLTRPVGAVVALLWLIVVPLLRGWRASWHLVSSAALPCFFMLLPLLVRNQREVGSFSLTQSLGRNLISVTDLLVDYSAPDPKGILSTYHRYLANKRGPDAVVVYSAMPELRQAVNRGLEAPERYPDVQVDRALTAAAWNAILLHPVDFLRSRLARLPLLFRDPAESQWYGLHLETYVTLIEFAGKQSPEMTSRTVIDHPLKAIDFPRAAGALERWRFPFDSPWFFALEVLGVMAVLAGVVAKERVRSFAALRIAPNGSGWLIFLGLAASLVTIILMQPPNLRYRTPTLPWEIVMAAAGLAFLADLAARGVVELGRRAGRTIPCWIPHLAVCMAGAGLFAAAQIPPGVSGIKVGDFVDSANQPADGPAIIRQMPLAGTMAPMIYWRSDMPASRTIRADAAVDSGGRHRLRAAFSCGDASCANAQLRLTSFNALAAAVGSQQMPLARERTDNDLFWEQIDERLTLPPGTSRVRFEISFEPGAGSLVIPFISLTR